MKPLPGICSTPHKVGLTLLKNDAGLVPDSPIDLYIFGSTNDMKDAILYEPSWTGGQAFPEQNIVILGISQAELDWGRSSIVHELTHVLVGHLTFLMSGRCAHLAQRRSGCLFRRPA